MTHRTTSWNTPYTFSGKEKDVETGYGFFGARYYDSGLSIWLSVDPMSDKYPSMSPYTYCANNPVVLLDPDGREIFLIFEGVKYTLTNGKIFVDGKETTNAPKNVTDINRYITNIKTTIIGKKILAPFEKKTSDGGSDITILFNDNLKSSQYFEKEITITHDQYPTPIINKDSAAGWENNLEVTLFHEFSHAYDDVMGRNFERIIDGLAAKDWVACFRENQYRMQRYKNYKLRSHYNVSINFGGAHYSGEEPAVLDKSFQPIDPKTKGIIYD